MLALFTEPKYEARAKAICLIPYDDPHIPLDDKQAAKTKCNAVESCQMFYYDPIDSKYYICPTGSTIEKTSEGKNILYVKGRRRYNK